MTVCLEVDPNHPLGYRLVVDDPTEPAQDTPTEVVAGRATVTAQSTAPDLAPTAPYDGVVRGHVTDAGTVLIEVFEAGAWHPLGDLVDWRIDPWTSDDWYAEGEVVLEGDGAGGWTMWRAGEYIDAPGTTPSTDPRWEPIGGATTTGLTDRVAALEARITELEGR
jgi:hypothetical protein